jgi:hypothetical protein
MRRRRGCRPAVGVALFACVAATTSSEPDVATPECSRIANRSDCVAVPDTMTVFDRPAMLSA